MEGLLVEKVTLICPDYPPMRGGLAHHTRRLAEALTRKTRLTLVTSPGAEETAGIDLRPVIGDWQDPSAVLKALEPFIPGPFVWQYVPHMYGRGGVNLGLPKVMDKLRKAGARQIGIIHEIAAPVSVLPQRFVYAMAHRVQWSRMLGILDGFGFSTEAWLNEWTERQPQLKDRACLLPSPSSIPVVDCPPDHRAAWRRQHGLPEQARMLAFFGTQSAAKQFSWVDRAWRAAHSSEKPVVLVVIGDAPQFEVPADLSRWVKALGYSSDAEVSRALQAADVIALPFIDGVSERRTSFMTGLSHGCPVVTTIGRNTGPTLRQTACFRSVYSDDLGAFAATAVELLNDDSARARLGASAKKEYAERYDWPRVTERLIGLIDPAQRA